MSNVPRSGERRELELRAQLAEDRASDAAGGEAGRGREVVGESAPLHCQQMVRVGRTHHGGDLLLATHRVNRHHAPATFSTRSRWGIAVISLDFSATARWPKVTPLAVAKALTRCRHGARGLAEPRMALPSTATCFSWQSLASLGHPTPEAVVEPFGGRQGKHASDGVVRRNAVGQTQKRLQPRFLGLAKRFHGRVLIYTS